jgi:hypothetical protein
MRSSIVHRVFVAPVLVTALVITGPGGLKFVKKP